MLTCFNVIRSFLYFFIPFHKIVIPFFKFPFPFLNFHTLF